METISGTFTFLFTDIEGSSRLWDQVPREMSVALANHDRLLRENVRHFGGAVFKTVGDAFYCVFEDPVMAVRAAVQAQIALRSTSDRVLEVRMALHTGIAELRDEDYFGPPLNRISRLLSTVHGGQIVLSQATRELVRDDLPVGAGLLDLGEHRLRDLTRPERVYQVSHTSLPSRFPRLKSLDSIPNNLPQQATRFVGREAQLDELREAIDSVRLLTVTGAGGCGKTRTILQVAADRLDAFPQGIWWIELASVTESGRLAAVIGETLGSGARDLGSVRERLRQGSNLLVLDNCEHLIQECASVVDDLLRNCSGLKVLTSSREPLGLLGERVYRLPSLSVPPTTRGKAPSAASLEQYEAVQLFLDRAQLAAPGFSVSDANAAAVAGICSRLDGIPLALELAAARLRAMSAPEIFRRLDDAFRLLTGGSRTALPRQQTLRGAIDWSHALLEPSETILFRRLAVFSGGWTLDAAESILPDGEKLDDLEVVDALSSLVDKSLVTTYEGPDGMRYRLLETVRQYALEQLPPEEASACRDRHLEFFTAQAQAASDPNVGQSESGRDPTIALFRESDNLRAAIAWSLADVERVKKALALLVPLHRTCLMRWSLAEVVPLWIRLLDQAKNEPASDLLVDAYGHAAWYLGSADRIEEARAYAERGVELADQVGIPLSAGRVLNALGTLCFKSFNPSEALAFYDQAMEKVHGYPRGECAIGVNISLAYSMLGEYDKAAAAIDRVAEILEAAHDPLNAPWLVLNRGDLAALQLQLDPAEHFLAQAIAMSNELEMPLFAILAYAHHYSRIPGLRGDFAECERRAEEGLRIVAETGSNENEPQILLTLAEATARQGKLVSALGALERVAFSKHAFEQARILRAAAWVASALNHGGLAKALWAALSEARSRVPFSTSPWDKALDAELHDHLVSLPDEPEAGSPERLFEATCGLVSVLRSQTDTR